MMLTQSNWSYGYHHFAETRAFHMLKIKPDEEESADKAQPHVSLLPVLITKIKTIWRSFVLLVETSSWRVVPLTTPMVLQLWVLRPDIERKESKDLNKLKS